MSEITTEPLRRIQNSLQSWTTNFIAQFEPTRVEIFRRIYKDSDWDSLAKSITADEIEKYDVPIIRKKIIFEKITGATLGLLALGLMFYADAVQAASTFSVLFPSDSIPAYLNIPLTTYIVITIIGISVLNGLPLTDILGATNFTNTSRITTNGKGGATRNTILIIRLSNLILTVVILSLSLIAEKNINIYALSFLIIPMLITTNLSLEFITGIFAVLSLQLFIIGILFGVLEWALYFLLRILRDFVYYQWLLFDKIIANPIRSLTSLITKR
jgi:hypothetical protein